MARIVLTSTHNPLDNAEGCNFFILGLAGELLARGHYVHIVTPLRCDARKAQDIFGLRQPIPIVSLTKRAGLRQVTRLFVWAGRGRRAVIRLRPDLVIVNGSIPVRFSRNDATVLHDCENWRLPQGFIARLPYGVVRNLARSASYNFSRHVVCTCHEIQETAQREISFARDKCRIIPLGIRPEVYATASLAARQRVILHIGTSTHKNPLATLGAFVRMQTQDARLVFTGGPSPQLQAALENLDPRVRGRVHLAGIPAHQEFVGWMRQARAVSIPSDYRVAVCSPSALENLAAGTPVVCSQTISRDVVPEGVCGYRVELSAYETRAVQHFDDLMCSDAHWAAMSEAAVRHVANFSLSRVAALYEHLLAGSPLA